MNKCVDFMKVKLQGQQFEFKKQALDGKAVDLNSKDKRCVIKVVCKLFPPVGQLI